MQPSPTILSGTRMRGDFMAEKRNNIRKADMNKRADDTAYLRSKKMLSAFMQTSKWDEAMNRKREQWLFERPKTSSKRKG